MPRLRHVDVYTDGGCAPTNPGPGGYAAILVTDNSPSVEISGGEAWTTNNRMELQAVIAALTHMPEDCSVTITTDSKYVHDGCIHWMSKWRRNGWLTAARKPVKNVDLWRVLFDEMTRIAEVNWAWTKGHAGHVYNERADELATAARIRESRSSDV